MRKPQTEAEKSIFIAELQAKGIKCNPNDIIEIGYDMNEKLIFLEKGNEKAGLTHIIDRHSEDFGGIGVEIGEIADVVFEAAIKGTSLGQQGIKLTREIFQIIHNGEKKNIAITISSNGFIVGANPSSL
jgi:hypothetical protein